MKALALAALTILVTAATGCPNNVSQNSHTGADGSMKHPKELTLVQNEASLAGIVTYPGGDRTDWMSVDIPKDEKGSLGIKLTWTTPRPGLQLSFEAYDAYGKKLSQTAASGRRNKNLRQHEETLADVSGKVLIRVFAVRRMDAGTYKLALSYTANPKAVIVDVTGMAINDPPRLPDMPAVLAACDPFDAKLESCKKVCPDPKSLAPDGWPPCKPKKGECDKDKPDENDPACRCNNPDKCPLKCPEDKDWDPKFTQCPMPKECPTPANLKIKACGPHATPGHILTVNVDGNGITTIVAVNANAIDAHWHVYVLKAGTQNKLPAAGADGKIVRVSGKQVIVQFAMTPDQLGENKDVMFTPP